MPTYVVTDPKTGRKLKMTGPKPPSGAEIQAAFLRWVFDAIQPPAQDPSVFDSTVDKVKRTVGELVGSYDPASTMMGAVGPLTAGQAQLGPMAQKVVGAVKNAVTSTAEEKAAKRAAAAAKAAQVIEDRAKVFAETEAGGVGRFGTLEGRAAGNLQGTLQPTSKVDVYDLAGDTKARARDLYRIGTNLPTTANWSGSETDELLNAFGGDEAKALQWARMWGATSPNTSAVRNTQESVSALTHSLENPGVPFTLELGRMQEGNLPKKITMANAKVPNLNAALRGEPLSGDKVEAMAGYMTGQNRKPIDVHTLYGLGAHETKVQETYPGLRRYMTQNEGLPYRNTQKAPSLTDTDLYLRYESALDNALKEIAPNRNPNQVFAEWWEGIRAYKGLAPQGGPIDMLRKKGLLEKGAMLDPERLRAALSKKGWSAGAIAGLMTAMSAPGASEQAP